MFFNRVIRNLQNRSKKYESVRCNHTWTYWDHLSDECTKCGKLKQTRGF